MELIIDNFAGGGGASTGIEMAIGRSVDIAINHDPEAIAMHEVNHPGTKHYCESVWDVDPVEAVGGRKVGLAWFSPDCKHFSKAKGGKPVDNNIRGLAWVAVKWAKAVKPRVIMLENVEEFRQWGPLKGDRPDPKQRGRTFILFIKALEKLGYKVDHRELRASDYGAPTIRRRFFLVARCDGKPIKWPEPTHGPPGSIEVEMGKLKPYRTAGEIIDWSIPMESIFERKKPLKENTLIRIARGIQKFIAEADDPYIVDDKAYFLQHYYTHQGTETRGGKINEPIATIPTNNRFALVSAFISQQYKNSVGHEIEKPLWTTTAVNKNMLIASFLIKYYGAGVGQKLNEPLHTITSKDRFGIVTIKGVDYKIADIAMRMLQPHELFAAQGFPEDYIIDRDAHGNKYPKTKQVARCGNSVPPPMVKTLVESNFADVSEEIREAN